MFGLEVTAGEPQYVYECVTKEENEIKTRNTRINLYRNASGNNETEVIHHHHHVHEGLGVFPVP
jgi:5-carboxymethyl-2-hydroxymuconate isomerase